MQSIAIILSIALVAVLLMLIRVARKTEAEPIATSPTGAERIFWLIPQPTLATRLTQIASVSIHEIGNGPASYLRSAFLPDRIREFFWIRLVRLTASAIIHPINVIRGALSGDEIDLKRRRRFVSVLTVSAALHGGLIVYLAYLVIMSQIGNMHVVDHAYRKLDADKLLEKLYYPPQMLRIAQSQNAMTLEEIKARAEKHKQELALAREKAEKEKREKEEADRKAAEEAAKVAAEKKPPADNKPGEININIAPIRDIVGNLYKLFDAGGLDIPEMRFNMMAGFKVMPDGSFDNIRIVKSSGSKIIDRNALEILSNLGESHALGKVSDLSSATISLEITDEVARIRIMAFAPTPEIAKEKTDLLNLLFWGLQIKEKGSELGKLLKMIKVKNDGKRVDTDLTVPREKAAEMFRAWSVNPAAPPQ